MNSVVLIGRLARDPEVRYSANQNAVASFTLAVDRSFARSGEERGADFIRCVAFGKQAEFVERYFYKGKLMALQGRIQTGSYQNKDGQTVYTRDVVADRVEFVGPKEEGRGAAPGRNEGYSNAPRANDGVPEGFQALEDDDDIPF